MRHKKVVPTIFILTMFRFFRLILSAVLITIIQISAQAQQNAQNHGETRMHATSQMAFFGDFTNTGVFENNKGTAYFNGSRLQNIFGTRAVDFQNLTLANDNGLVLHTPVAVTSVLNFQKGLIQTPRETPSVLLTFGIGGRYTNAGDTKHINGYCAKIGRDSFMFPIGDGQKMRTAGTSQTTNQAATFRAAYFKGNPSVATLPQGAPFPISQKQLTILRVSQVEYWDVKGATPTQVTLTWNLDSEIEALTDNDMKKLGVVGWNGREWVNLGNDGVVGTVIAGRVRSRVVTPDSFTVYTLAYLAENQRCVTNAPTLTMSRSITICPGYPAVIDGRINGYQFQNYLWSNGSTAATFTAQSAGKYWVTAWDSCGVAQSDTFYVKLLPSVKLKVDSTTCYGTHDGRITILNDTTNMRVWLNNQPTFASALGGLPAGSYNVKIQSPYTCGLDTTVYVHEPPQKVIRIEANVLQPKPGDEVTLTARPQNGYRPVFYQWTPPSQMSCPTCQVTTTTLQDKDLHSFTVIAVDSNGCKATDEIVINTGKNRRYSIYVPNIFKPDHEEYTVLGNPNHVKVRYMRIFDRWGELIFEGKDFKPDGSVTWDGSFRGKPLNMGTFVVVVEAEFIDGTVQKIARDLLLVR
ncbi:MAG: gliding motility-associated C-terminal domain-containing protein [Saprospiraceae bacterium]|nr:gliding motility-associated C-terminal domain-containing protein [Saprospiraceae bacterium]